MSARDVWAGRITRWKASGLTAAAFARRHRLSVHSLKWWKWKLGATIPGPSREKKKAAASSPLTFIELATTGRSEALEVVLDGGAQVRVPVGFDDETLARLLSALERRR